MNIIKIKRGVLGNMPVLLQGELAYAIDTNELYIGTPTGNKILSADLGEIDSILADYVKTADLNATLTDYVTTSVLNLQLGVKLNIKPDGENDLVIGNKINSTYIDNLYITDIFVVANQAAMLALTDAKQGDFAIRTDLGTTFALKQEPAATLANWVELPTPAAPVLSVNDKTGVVTIGISDISGLQNALNLKLDIATYESDIGTIEGDIVDLETNKVDKVTGKGLSDENYTSAEKTKLSGIATGAQVNRAIANEAQAIAGESNSVDMTPLRVAQFVENATIDGGEWE